jgi:Ca2+-binding EF-hand superfamily protein
MIFLLVLKHGFRKVAKKNDYILVEEIGNAFRHSGQNPTEDVVKDMIDKANKLKASYHREDEG